MRRMDYSGLRYKHYRVIYIDPPWEQKTWSTKGRDRLPDHVMPDGTVRHYQTIPMEDLKLMPIKDLAHKDGCVLLMWVMDNMLDQTIDLGGHWGFKFKTVGFTWVKVGKKGVKVDSETGLPLDSSFTFGGGKWTRTNTEMCLLFTRGSPRREGKGVRRLVVDYAREHSRKPDIHDRIETLVPGPYLEMFGRQERPGWTVWGDQVEKFNEAAE